MYTNHILIFNEILKGTTSIKYLSSNPNTKILNIAISKNTKLNKVIIIGTYGKYEYYKQDFNVSIIPSAVMYHFKEPFPITINEGLLILISSKSKERSMVGVTIYDTK